MTCPPGLEDLADSATEPGQNELVLNQTTSPTTRRNEASRPSSAPPEAQAELDEVTLPGAQAVLPKILKL